jgi:hypothetical protein
MNISPLHVSVFMVAAPTKLFHCTKCSHDLGVNYNADDNTSDLSEFKSDIRNCNHLLYFNKHPHILYFVYVFLIANILTKLTTK